MRESQQLYIGPLGPIEVSPEEALRLRNVRDAAFTVDALNTPAELVEALQNGTTELRWRAAAKLRGCGIADQYVICALIVALQDDAWEVREAATRALADFNRKDVRDALSSVLDDDSDDVSWQAANALVAMHDRRAIKRLVYCLKFGRVPRRVRAAELLGTLGDQMAIGALKTSADDDSDAVRAASQAALRRLAA